jgi:hypothetical protein
MEFAPEILAIVIGFMVLSNRLVEALVTPIFEKYKLEKFWLMYVAWAVSGILVWLSGLNLFVEFMPDPLVGKILTAIVAGGGANLLHDLTDRQGEILQGETESFTEEE